MFWLRSKNVRFGYMPKTSYMFPVRWFCSRCTMFKLVKFLRLLGIWPKSCLLSISSSINCKRFPISAETKLEYRYKPSKLLRLLIEGGRTPLSRLRSNPKLKRDWTFPRIGGIEPKSELSPRCNTAKLLKLPKKWGIEPLSWFSDKSRWKRDFKFPISEGTEEMSFHKDTK